MDIPTIRAFFMWCTVLNGGVLILTSLVLAFAGDFVYRIHRRWFPIPRETFDAAIYFWLGLLKLVFITFNLVPFLALMIIGEIGKAA